jgi:NitT/TauT family transport system substrate-binding protein
MKTLLFVAPALLPAVLLACGSTTPQPAGQPAPSRSAPLTATGSPSAKPVSPASGQAQRLTIPFITTSASTLPYWIAYDKGLYQKRGLTVEIELIPTSTTITASMLAGEIPISQGGEDPVITANLGGGDLAIIASGGNKLTYSVYAAQKLNTIADLKGKKLAVPRVGTTGYFGGRSVLAKYGLDIGKDVETIQTNGGDATLAALVAGSADAAILSTPGDYQAKKSGYKELGNLVDPPIPYETGPLVARRSWMKDHRDVALNVTRAFVEAISVVYRDKSTAVSVLGKYTKSDDQGLLEDSYQKELSVLSKAPRPTVEAIKTGLQESTVAGAKSADPSTFIDSSLVDELQSSGFIDSLYR